MVSDEEGTMRKIVLLIAATALFLCSVDVWAGGSRTGTTDDAAVFVICNAL